MTYLPNLESDCTKAGAMGEPFGVRTQTFTISVSAKPLTSIFFLQRRTFRCIQYVVR